MIGVFDSGYGGLNILSSLLHKLPAYDFIYLGDNARAPYGARSFEVIYEFTKQGVKWLFDNGCTVVVVACNTASARALRTLQQKWLPVWYSDRRLLGIVRPSAEALAGIPVGEVSNEARFEAEGRVAILGTLETIRSRSYELELRKLAPNLQVCQHPCPIWAALVETGEAASDGAEWFVQRSLAELFDRFTNIDRILLACTHYVALLPLIQKHLPSRVQILTQADPLQERLADWLKRHPEFDQRMSRTATRQLFTTDDAGHFSEVAGTALGTKVEGQRIVLDRDLPFAE
jgi:glutamate racemase